MKVLRINSYNAFCIVETPFNKINDNRAVVKSIKRYWVKTGFAPKPARFTRAVRFEIAAGWGRRLHQINL